MSLDISLILPWWQVLLLAVLSFLVGILGGFVGLALGTMRLPALLLIGVSPSTAAGTNILVSTLCALAGGYRHIQERRVNWRLAGLMGGPAVVGSFMGGFAGSSSVSEGALILTAGAFVFWQAVEFLMRLRQVADPRPRTAGFHGEEARAAFTLREGVIGATVGLVVGVVGGAVGLILGSVRLPLLIRVLRADPRIAAGSNLVIGFFMGGAGFIGHGIRGELDLVILAAMGLSGMAGTYIGARLTGRATINAIMLTMSAVLLVVGVLLIRDGLGRLLG